MLRSEEVAFSNFASWFTFKAGVPKPGSIRLTASLAGVMALVKQSC